MPSPRKRTAVLAGTNKQKLKVKVSGVSPARQSSRIKANAEIKSEPEDDDRPKKKTKGKGKTKASNSKKKVIDAKPAPKMSVLALAAARKRKLNGEDDDEPVRQKKPKKKSVKKKVYKKKNVPLHNEDEHLDDEDDEEGYRKHYTVAIKQEGSDIKDHNEDGDGNDDEDDDDDVAAGFDEDTHDVDEEQQNLLINDQHQYIEQMTAHHEIAEEPTEIEVPQEQVQAELQQDNDVENDDDDDDDDEQEDDEDIDENLFFGIPEQRSPELATCTHCKGKFRKEDVHEHMLSCPERYVQCRECGKILSNLQTLERHHKRFHLKIREVPCTLCDKMFIDEAAARKHLKTVHFKVKNFHCPHCDKSFSQRNKLTYHVRTHSGEKPYSCAECGRSFSLLWNLKTHLRTHTGEKPYACDTCGRRFTQKQNMTSHLTTHRKPKADKGFRNNFPTDLDDYDTNSSGILSNDFSTKPSKPYRTFEQAKHLNPQSIGSGHYVLGDMQSIEVRTASEQEGEQNVNLEHGLGLLSSVARKGDQDVQVDGIVNIPENQLATSGSNLDQVVEVLIHSNGETDSAGNPLTTLQLGNGHQAKIILDPNTQSITDADGQEIPLDTHTAAGLANILQNPDVLAAINSAASTNKFIVIGPVSMFDGSSTQASSIVSLSTAETDITTDATSTFSQEQLAQISAMVNQNSGVVTQVSSQSVNDSISAASALAAVEGYLHGEQPSSSLIKRNPVINILGSIQPDGRSGPSAVLQSAQASMSRSSNLTISMPPMSQNSLTISPANLSINADSRQRMKPLLLQNNHDSSSEVSSSADNVSSQQSQDEEDNEDEQMEAESTTQKNEFTLSRQTFVHTTGAADSSNITDTNSSNLIVDDGDEASSSGEPILMLSTDENGQPQIIVKMPDGSETIMSDPALAESLIQVPTITNAEMEGVDVSGNEMEAVGISNEAEAVHTIHMDQMTNAIELQMADQGIPSVVELPTQSSEQQEPDQFATQSSEVSANDDTNEEFQQSPDQSLAASSTMSGDASMTNDDVDSSENAQLINYTQQNLITESSSHQSSMQVPDSSSQSFQGVVAESHIDSRQGIFVMEHVSGSDQEQPQQSEYSAEQSNIDFPEGDEKSEFVADSSSGVNSNDMESDGVSGSAYLQMGDVSQSTNTIISESSGGHIEIENVSSTEQPDN